jgi:hypothetical protein
VRTPDFVNHHSEAEGDILFDMLRLLSFVALFSSAVVSQWKLLASEIPIAA